MLGKVLDRVLPDKAARELAQLKLLELAQTGQLAELDADVKLAVGQMEINKAEAASGNGYASSWRPSVGYVGCAGLAYSVLLQPLMPWALKAFGVEGVEPLPSLDTNVLMTILGGMLGIGGMRSFDKARGTSV
jgi:hypothetical protein